MQIGRRLYYNVTDGIVILNTGEMQGDVIETSIEEDVAIYPQLKDYTPDTVHNIQLEYGYRFDEFMNAGSVRVNEAAQEIIIYPRLNISADKYEVNADGFDSASIIVSVQDTVNAHTISLTINNNAPIISQAIGGMAIVQFDTTLPGDYIITATSDLYGSGTIIIKGV